jgi:uncharacterized protein with PQ loop repeat
MFIGSNNRRQKMKISKAEFIGYVGMAMLQFNSIPAIISALETGASAPIATIVLSIAGLACYLYNSLKTDNTLYTVGNTIGIIGNSILLFSVLYK